MPDARRSRSRRSERLWLVAQCVLCALLVSGCRGLESPGDKQEWAALQRLELSSRGQIASGVEFRTLSGYEAMGAPRDGDSRLVWVLLKPTHGAQYKQMPEGNYYIGKELWRDLVRQQRVSTTVAEALRGHLRVGEQDSGSPGAIQPEHEHE